MGARPVQVFRTVVLPLIAPHVLTGFTLVAIISVNEYLIANMISGFVVETLPIKIFNNVRYGYSPVVAAASMLFEGIVEAVTYKTDQGFTVGRTDKGLSIFGPNYAGIDATFRTPLSI